MAHRPAIAAVLALALLAMGGCRAAGPDFSDPPAPAGVGAQTEDPSPTLGGQPRTVEPVSSVAPGPVDPILDSPWSRKGDATREVGAWVEYWTDRGRAEFQLYLERMSRWSPLVDGEIQEQGLPESLKFLPVIESGYTATAVSSASAVGMWQFMAPTARGYGLEVNSLVDERRDPWAATPYALRYLGSLSQRFGGSWHLALAAYNAGPGRVERLLRQYAPDAPLSDSLYWALRSRLPRETRAFVPKFLAAATVGSDPEAFGFTDIEVLPPLTFDEVAVPDATSLDVVARLAGVEQRAVEGLNPHLVRGLTPAGVESALRVPSGTGNRFTVAYRDLPPEERVTFVEHRVASGETLTHLARRYGVRVAEIQAANPRIDPRRMRIGQRVVVPTAPSARAALVASQDPPPSADGGTAVAAAAPRPTGATRSVVHRIEPGESLWSIARKYGATVSEVREWNRLGDGEVIYPGDELVVRTALVVEYVVKRGDTLSGIAQRFGVGTRELAQANGLSLQSVIRPGDRMQIPPAGS